MVKGPLRTVLFGGLLGFLFLATARSEEVPFARLEADPPTVYAGQPFTLLLSVFTTGQDLEPGMKINGLPDALQLQTFQEMPALSQTEGGRTYQVLRSRCDAIAPHPGRFQFAPVIQGVSTRTIQTFFFVQRIQNNVQIQIQPIPLEVKPIPLEQAPKDYAGLIGTFHLAASLSTNRVLPGDLVTLTCTLSGTGRFDRVPPLGIHSSPGFKLYPPRLETARSGATVRTYTQVMIPLNVGSRLIPGLKLTAFNPSLGSFETLSAGPFPLVEDTGRPTNQPSTIVMTMPGANGLVAPSLLPDGKAMLYLLRTLRTQPRNPTAQRQLRQLLDTSAIPFPPALPPWSQLSRNEWLTVSGSALALGLIALGLRRRRYFSFVARLLTVITLPLALLASAGAAWWMTGPPASERVVTAALVQGRLAPTEASAPSIRLTEGMVVTRVDTSGAWVRVMAGDLAVWIPDSALEQP